MVQNKETKDQTNAAWETELRGQDMLCFSHDWGGDPLSKTHVMRLLAADNRVLWVNSIGYRAPSASTRDLRRAFQKLAAALEPVREVEKNIFVLNPIAIPAYGPRAQVVNRELLKLQIKLAMKRLGFKRPINWVFNPAAGILAGELGEERVFYYCVDEYTVFDGVATDSMVDIERRLLRRADLVICSAIRLYERKLPENPRTVLVRHGVNYAHFHRATLPETEVPAEVRDLPRPVIGYFGLMGKDWIDIDLMVHVAKHFSGGSMVLLGKVTTDVSRLAALPNVHLLGRKDFSELPGYSKGFDVAILPFPISEVTLHANPLKVREYLAAGLPVVSTPIPEVEVLGLCRIAGEKDHFVREIEAALAEEGDRTARSERMKDQTWAGRVDEIRRHVAALPRR